MGRDHLLAPLQMDLPAGDKSHGNPAQIGNHEAGYVALGLRYLEIASEPLQMAAAGAVVEAVAVDPEAMVREGIAGVAGRRRQAGDGVRGDYRRSREGCG